MLNNALDLMSRSPMQWAESWQVMRKEMDEEQLEYRRVLTAFMRSARAKAM